MHSCRHNWFSSFDRIHCFTLVVSYALRDCLQPDLLSGLMQSQRLLAVLCKILLEWHSGVFCIFNVVFVSLFRSAPLWLKNKMSCQRVALYKLAPYLSENKDKQGGTTKHKYQVTAAGLPLYQQMAEIYTGKIQFLNTVKRSSKENLLRGPPQSQYGKIV